MSETAGIPHRTLRGAGALVLVIAGLFTFASLVGHHPADFPLRNAYPFTDQPANWCGLIGAWVSALLFESFGLASWVVPLAALSLGLGLLRGDSPSRWLRRAIGYGMVILSASAGARLLENRFPEIFHPIYTTATLAGNGGLLGLVSASFLLAYLSEIGTAVILFPLAVTGCLLTSDPLLLVGWRFLRWLVRGGYAALKWLATRTVVAVRRQPRHDLEPELADRSAADAGQQSSFRIEEAPVTAEENPLKWEHPRQELKIIRNSEPVVREPGLPIPATKTLPAPSSALAPHVRLPNLGLLDESIPVDTTDHDDEIRERASIIEKTFAEFQMRVQVVQIDTGPVVTQYEIELEPGLRARRVISLADDLAIALRAAAVRVVAPIPGKNTVGIEVPNARRGRVSLREVIEQAGAQVGAMRLPLFLGKDVRGQPLLCDLANLPHLLIAGRTGTGKSVCLNALILSVLMTRTPDQVKLLMIDPKMVELSLYKDIPHLLHPVVTEMRKAEALLCWAVETMEKRYDLLARVGVRHIDSYNKLAAREIHERLQAGDAPPDLEVPEHLPYLLIFADEMADLMMTAPKEVESHIIRLAQKSRAVGIHLVLATQKPTVDVITGLIKSNLPARIAFQVASKSDSRVILDEMGADRLLGNGDLLFLYPGTSTIVRAQGTFVGDAEVSRVVESLCAQAKPQYLRELLELKVPKKATEDGPDGGDVQRDELYGQAVEIVVREQRGSVSLLQRNLGIGYGRAARLIDFMAEDGLVGEYNGAQAREVLLSLEQWSEARGQRLQAAR